MSRQTSFAAGEFAPELWGRTDLAAYRSGFRTGTNMVVTPYGSMANRPGTVFIHTPHDGKADQIRIAPFIFSDTDTILVLFAKRTGSSTGIYIYPYDSTTGRAAWNGVYLSATPYQSVDLAKLRFSQIGDIITIVHPDVTPRELRRMDSTNLVWEFGSITFTAASFPTDQGIPVLLKPLPTSTVAGPKRDWKWQVTRIMRRSTGETYETLPYTVTQAADLLMEEYNQSNDYPGSTSEQDWRGDVNSVFLPADGSFTYSKVGMIETGPGSAAGAIGPDINGDTPWWNQLAIGDPTQQDNYWHRSVVPLELPCYPSTPVRLHWSIFPESSPIASGDPTITATRIYRGRDGMFGYIGETSNNSFVDEGDSPDFSRPPPQGASPFNVPYGSTEDDAQDIECPSVVSVYEGRRIFASTDERPSTMWASAVEDYKDFDVVSIPLDSDSIEFELATSKWELIKAIIPRQYMVVLTDSSEWLVGGSGLSEVLTPNSMAARVVSSHGSADIYPLEIGEFIVFVQRKGTIPRALGFNGSQTTVLDMASLSRHLFIGSTIVSWAWAEDPWSTIWAACSNGSLLSCAFVPDHELIAWTPHAISGGLVEDICSMPEGTEDSVYLVVNRSGVRTLERFASRIVTDAKAGVFLDGSVTIDGRNQESSATIDQVSGTGLYDTCTVTFADRVTPSDVVGKVIRVHRTPPVWDAGTSYEVGDDVRVTDPNYDDKVYVAAHAVDTENRNVYPSPGGVTNFWTEVDLGRTALVKIISEVGGDVYNATNLSDISGMDGVVSDSWSICNTVVSGLQHLEGQAVTALVDGLAQTTCVVNQQVNDLVVNGGSVQLSDNDEDAAEIITVGMAYESRFVSLDEADHKDRAKTISKIILETYGTRGGYVAQFLDNDYPALLSGTRLQEVRSRMVSHGFGEIPMRNEETEIQAVNRWAKQGMVAYIQTDPLPITITGITRLVKLGT
jgi:hypothetical protein